MSERAMDRMVIRTRRMIRDALTGLMEEKGFEGITVSDLTAKADINRGTFYLHYRDKHDLLKQSEDEVISEIERITNIARQSATEDVVILDYKMESPFPFVLKLLEYILEHADFMKTMLGPKGDPLFQVKLKEVMKKSILNNLFELNDEEMMVPPEYFFAYLCSAHLGVIQHWLENGMEKSPQEMSMILSRITMLGPGYISGLVKNLNSNS